MQYDEDRENSAASSIAPQDDTLSPDMIGKQVHLICDDPLFSHSRRYSKFLCHIVEKALSGDTDELKERLIGVELFGRKADYDTNEDSVVRVVAGEVRKRLIKFYQNNPDPGLIYIKIPVGSYTPSFGKWSDTVHLGNASEESTPPADDRASSEEDSCTSIDSYRPRQRKRQLTYTFLAVFVCLSIVAAVYVNLRYMAFFRTSDEIFWGPLLNKRAHVQICLQTPVEGDISAELLLLDGDTPQLQSVQPFVRLTETVKNQFTSRTHVPLTDVILENQLSNYFRSHNQYATIHASGQLSLTELKTGPTVFIGAWNEWFQRLSTQLRFQTKRTEDRDYRWIYDSQDPSNKKWSIHLKDQEARNGYDYAVITRFNDPSTGHWWVSIAGLSAISSDVALQMVTDPKKLNQIARRWPRNWKTMNIQMVVMVKLSDSIPRGSEVIAIYLW
jgi:hypothetical protein